MTNPLRLNQSITNKRNQITVWDRIDRKFETEYGIVNYLEWCQKELTRLSYNNKIEYYIKEQNIANRKLRNGGYSYIKICAIFCK